MGKAMFSVLALLSLAMAVTVPNQFEGEDNEVISG